MDFDFSLFLVIASIVTGILWGGYLLYLKSIGEPFSEKDEPFWAEYARSFFPVVLIVLLLRSFLVEPFRIPSGSMMPTLLIGDFILVNKFAYGVRLPVLHTKIIELSEPERGDVMVFRYPKEPAVDYIKRVIGLPGDKITYKEKQVYINDKLMPQIELETYEGLGQGKSMSGAAHLTEDLETVKHSILVRQEPRSNESVYIVPQGHYFVMGDNRDNSNDSRYWGTVPEENLVGKAFFVWMNWDLDHIGVNFNRLGTIIR
ncbi:MAG: signal peptidase I [Methylococcales bacterium]|nr:signal peptidase I [Methylococcales bacterium]